MMGCQIGRQVKAEQRRRMDDHAVFADLEFVSLGVDPELLLQQFADPAGVWRLLPPECTAIVELEDALRPRMVSHGSPDRREREPLLLEARERLGLQE